jgi:hypothetical protein
MPIQARVSQDKIRAIRAKRSQSADAGPCLVVSP